MSDKVKEARRLYKLSHNAFEDPNCSIDESFIFLKASVRKILEYLEEAEDLNQSLTSKVIK